MKSNGPSRLENWYSSRLGLGSFDEHHHDGYVKAGMRRGADGMVYYHHTRTSLFCTFFSLLNCVCKFVNIFAGHYSIENRPTFFFHITMLVMAIDKSIHYHLIRWHSNDQHWNNWLSYLNWRVSGVHSHSLHRLTFSSGVKPNANIYLAVLFRYNTTSVLLK